jgi:hypothetical protein
MFECMICHYDDIQLDDVAIKHSDGRRCICLKCFERETGRTPHLSKRLVRDAREGAGSE